MPIKDEAGQGMVEYGLIVVLVLVFIVTCRYLAIIAYDAWLLSSQVGQATINIDNRVEFLKEKGKNDIEIQASLARSIQLRLELDFSFQGDIELSYKPTLITIVVPRGTQHKGVFSEPRQTRRDFVYKVYIK